MQIKEAFVTDPDRQERTTSVVDAWAGCPSGINNKDKRDSTEGPAAEDSSWSDDGTSSSGEGAGGASGSSDDSGNDAEERADAMSVSLGLCVGATALWLGMEVVSWGFTILLELLVGLENAILVFDS